MKIKFSKPLDPFDVSHLEPLSAQQIAGLLNNILKRLEKLESKKEEDEKNIEIIERFYKR